MGDAAIVEAVQSLARGRAERRDRLAVGFGRVGELLVVAMNIAERHDAHRRCAARAAISALQPLLGLGALVEPLQIDGDLDLGIGLSSEVCCRSLR